MSIALAYAEGPDTSDSGLTIVVIGLIIIAAFTLLAAVPSAAARRRRHRHLEGIIAAMVIWAALFAGSAIYFTNAQMKWSTEYNRRLMSGYGDPLDKTDKPRTPWALWAGLVLAYGGVTWWAIGVKPIVESDPTPPGGFAVIQPDEVGDRPVGPEPSQADEK